MTVISKSFNQLTIEKTMTTITPENIFFSIFFSQFLNYLDMLWYTLFISQNYKFLIDSILIKFERVLADRSYCCFLKHSQNRTRSKQSKPNSSQKNIHCTWRKTNLPLHELNSVIDVYM